MSEKKFYLGDGVYIKFDNMDRVILTSGDGISVQNTIYLEDFVIKGMVMILKNEGKIK